MVGATCRVLQACMSPRLIAGGYGLCAGHVFAFALGCLLERQNCCCSGGELVRLFRRMLRSFGGNPMLTVQTAPPDSLLRPFIRAYVQREAATGHTRADRACGGPAWGDA